MNVIERIDELMKARKWSDYSLAQFFTENTFSVQLNSEQKEFFDSWVSLTDEQKLLCSSLIKEFNKSK